MSHSSFLSTDPQIEWPGMPSERGALQQALLFQLDRTQWWSPEELHRHQLAQLGHLLAHVHQTVPYYRARLDDAGYRPNIELTREMWARLPVLTRKDVQQAGDGLSTLELPPNHGRLTEIKTSGSTGMPVKVLKSSRAFHFWNAMTLRDHLWHGRDFSRKLCAVRDAEAILGVDMGHHAGYPNGVSWNDWGGAVAQVFRSAPSAALHIHTPAEQQMEWLLRQDPGYLVTFPSNLMDLVKYCARSGIRFRNLSGISTLGEVVTPELRAACRETWALDPKDIYSAAEIGYMALQCPQHDHYHVQSEVVLLEVLDSDNRPCAPGEVGRIVVTPLHNYGTPLIRYEVGDHAEVGDACPCGRGLPVLTRVMGRVRNMLTLPSGQRIWPEIEGGTFSDVAPVSQFQVIQRSLNALEVRLVVEAPVTAAQEDTLRQMLRERFQHNFEIVFTYHESIPRSRSGKYEDFRSEIPA